MGNSLVSAVGNLVPKRVMFAAARRMLVVKKNSPTIFFVAGIGATTAGTVLACRATLKLPDKLDNIKKDVDELKDLRESLDNGATAVYSEDKYHKDAAYVYLRAALEITKLYAPAVVVSGVGVGMLTGSHIQQKNRTAAAMAAYATLQKAYDDYRERVRDQLGEEHELEFHRGIRKEIVKNELGVKKEVDIVDPMHRSPYARIFDDISPHWEKDAEYNRMFLEGQRQHLNRILQTRGHVFLNDVYDRLGLERSPEGAVVGWLHTKDDNSSFIDFGIHAAYNSRFVMGYERSILLDFNPDGIIYDKI